jgi:ankyrin repeat protein
MLSYDSNIDSDKLHLAVKQGSYEILRILLEKDELNPNSLLDDDTTPLHLASQTGDEKMVQLLLRNKADPKLKTKHGSTALILAAQFGHFKVVDVLLKNDPELIRQEVVDGFNPLIIASQQGHLQVVKILLDRGANPKLTTAHGSTALHLASQKGHLHVIKALVEKDPTLVDQRTMNGFTCINLAENHGCSEVVEFFNKFKRGLDVRSSQGEKTRKPSEEKISDAWRLLKENKFEDLKLLIKDDRSILFDHKYSKATMAAGGGSSEKTLFHLLVENGSDEAIKILRENSEHAHFKLTCTIQHQNLEKKIVGEVEGITPLYLAVQKGRKAMVEFLITESDVDCVVSKKSLEHFNPKYSLLEGAVKEANLKGGDSFEILKIITGDNPNGKKANFYSFRLTEDEKQNQKERIARKFQLYSDEVKVLLREKYPTEIAEIEKMSDEKRGPEPSPSNGGASQPRASRGNEGFYV